MIKNISELVCICFTLILHLGHLQLAVYVFVPSWL
jgi:hypothetical protein